MVRILGSRRGRRPSRCILRRRTARWYIHSYDRASRPWGRYLYLMWTRRVHPLQERRQEQEHCFCLGGGLTSAHRILRRVRCLGDELVYTTQKYQVGKWHHFRRTQLTLPSPCRPSILLNITSSVLGRMPALPSELPPWIVYVLPEFVTP